MNPRTRLILSIVGVIVLLVAFFFLFIRPRQQELARVNDEVAAEEARTTQLQAELQRLQDLQANAPELQAELSKIRGFVPRDDEVPNFIFLVQDAANAAGVDFVQISPELPKPPPEGAALAEIRVTLRSGGGYFAVQDFVRRLHALDRAVRVDNLALGAALDTDTGETDVTMTSAVRIFFEARVAATGPAAPAPGAPVAPATPAPLTSTPTPAG